MVLFVPRILQPHRPHLLIGPNHDGFINGFILQSILREELLNDGNTTNSQGAAE